MTALPPAVRRWLPLAAMVLICVGTLVMGSRGRGESTAADRADSIAGRVKCPTCQGLSVAQSRTGLAIAIHEEIQRQVDLGRSDAEVMGYISTKYGDGLIINPPATGAGAVVWVAPIAFVLLGFAGLGVALRRWSSSSPTGDRPEASTDLAAIDRAKRAVRGATDE
jgi:cytochrome c-type biogenesis protein CcmH